MEIISYGGGIQTAALLVLTARKKINLPATHAVMADTGSELLATLAHVKEIMVPYAKQFGIELIIEQSELGPLDKFIYTTKKVPIPAYGDRGGMLYRRCTERWKIRVVRKWLRKMNAKKAIVQLGISVDEIQRMKNSSVQWVQHRFPLIELRLSRADCIKILEDENLPVPPRSACFMCPFRSPSGWQRMKNNMPQDFKKAVALEKILKGLYLHPTCKPLEIAVGDQFEMFNDTCGGYCWT